MKVRGSNNSRRIAHLIAGYNQGVLTPKEQDELDEWVGASDQNLQIFERFTQFINRNHSLAESDKNIRDILTQSKNKYTRWFAIRTFWIGAMAAICLGFFYILTIYNPKQASQIATLKDEITTIKRGSARIRLEPGAKSTPSVSGLNNGVKQNRFQTNYGTQQQYINSKTVTAGNYDSVITYFGEKALIKLPDGSQVELMDESKVRFPKTFKGNRRTVFIGGDAIVSVATMNDTPFEVDLGLGANVATRDSEAKFSIESTPSDAGIIVKALKGRADVKFHGENVLIAAGQQAQINLPLVMVDVASGSDPVAGSNYDVFHFVNANVEDVLMEISRWYGVGNFFEIKWRKIVTPYTLTISKQRSLPEVIQLLNQVSNVEFYLSGTTIILMSKKSANVDMKSQSL
jgi:ferric-dicitrate binding protein FerR (iron transport regulator)